MLDWGYRRYGCTHPQPKGSIVKNLLISIVAALVLCVSSSAKADTTYEKRLNVVKLVIKTKAGYELLHYEWTKPVTTLIKTCNGDPKRECVYVLKGRKEVFLYDYQAALLTYPRYVFRTEPKLVASR